MSGKFSKSKGNRYERHILKTLGDYGVKAERVPLSGAVKGGSFEADIHAWMSPGQKWFLECKKGSHVPKKPYDWLMGVDALIMARDREMDLIVMPLNVFLDFIKEIKK